MLEIFREILIVVVLAYVGFGLVLFFNQKNLIYYPNDQDFDSCGVFRDSEKLNLNGTRAYFKRNSDKLVVFYHGNAGSACDRDYMKDEFEKAGLSWLIVEYAGYSGDVQKPSSELLKSDARNVSDFVEKENFSEVVVSGESIGSSLAVFHSTLSEVDGMILITPFYAISDMARSFYWMYPVLWMLREKYDSGEWIKNTTAKRAVIVHGSNDEIVPLEQSKKLFDEMPIQSKEFVEIEGAKHNDIYGFVGLYTAISQFLKE